MRRLVLAFLLSLAFAFAADVTGTWQFTVETGQGTGTPTVTLEQKGEQLTGTYHSQVLGEAKLTGTVKGDAIDFGFEGEAGGQTIKVHYKGTIQSPTAMKGTGAIEGLDANVTWTAAKK